MFQTVKKVYPITHKLKGHVLILSNTAFSRCRDFENRKGGEQDCTLMKELFEQLGFKVDDSCPDGTAEQMREKVENFSRESFHKQADACIVIIMSHGGSEKGETVFYGTDGKPVNVDDVVRYFDNDNCQNLRGKPKLFLFQFCRGTVADKGVKCDMTDGSSSLTEQLKRLIPDRDDTDRPSNTAMDHIPTRTDVLIAFATQQGQVSFRSWFTNAIFNVFSKKAHKDHLSDMLNEVKRGLNAKVSSTSNDATNQCKEMMDLRDILLKNLYFFPGFPEK